MWSQLEDHGFWLGSSPGMLVQVPIWGVQFQRCLIDAHPRESCFPGWGCLRDKTPCVEFPGQVLSGRWVGGMEGSKTGSWENALPTVWIMQCGDPSEEPTKMFYKTASIWMLLLGGHCWWRENYIHPYVIKKLSPLVFLSLFTSADPRARSNKTRGGIRGK